ncbi:cryptochrome/photolyase family protein [Gracilibacillus kekensis]|uniref:Deoxyribodipyrimidine photo-lyase n=1 Tax=Gracilibacillus kekensis TaxID=1027249 RepID=A0A1M7L1C6_9BACI|nr:deoxyribodipyrimidine photo-lyase [Gracilibacillus kekensis]SHM71526.1 deoxyribodipyrimidine photo-lyase type I [Gracilibacillus kekensis]
MTNKIIVWLRRDFRLMDNPALYHAAQDGIVIPVYIHKPSSSTHNLTNSDLYHHQAVFAFQQTIKNQGGTLLIRKGNPEMILTEIVKEVDASALYFNYSYDPKESMTDQKIYENLRIPVQRFHSSLLTEPGTIINKQGNPYKVFTSFWKNLRALPIKKPLLQPKAINWYKSEPEETDLETSSKLRNYWKAGETAALEKWRYFLQNQLTDYQEYRNFPGIDATSLLSPHLAQGEITPRLIWHETKETLELISMEKGLSHRHEESAETFLKQLAWRDFAYHQLVEFPHIIDQPLQSSYLTFPWLKKDEVALEKWKYGITGYSLVDAGMRELKETGYMHNRVRMVTASFLVKHLLTHWLEGQAYFEKHLVDHDIANNTLGWQWVAGTGFDSSPFFRIFNPVKQAEKFDPDGIYIRKWLPELSDLPTKYLYQPSEASKEILKQASVEIGQDYPAPIVEHTFARERALEAFQRMKKGD